MGFKHAAIQVGIATSAFTFGSGALAQDINTPATEEVLVTGIRSSLQHAIDLKRNSDEIVDSIASESLGKFPDTNIAESLQRITGVSIDRSGGEGQAVTVRGFGPQFNTVLLNGRRIVSDTGSRSFNFDMLPSELVSRVDVYKSSAAHLQSGGIGSTIVMHSPRPLEIGSFKGVASAKGLYEELAEKTSPQLFGMVSNTFADGKAGLLLSVTYEERKNRLERFLTDGIIATPRDGLTLIADDLAAQGYAEDDQFFVPQVFNISPVNQERERINVNSTFQYEFNDDLTLTLDGMYGKFDVQSKANSLTFFVTPSIITSATFDENRTAIQHTQNSDAAIDFTVSELSRPTDSYAFGGNVEWDFADGWNLAVDTSWSQADSGGASGTNVVVIGFRDSGYTLNYDENGVPSYSGVTDEQILDRSLTRAHFNMRGIGGGPLGGAPDIKHDLFEQRVDFNWQTDFTNLKAISFGLHYSDESESTTSRSTDDSALCIYCGYYQDVPDELIGYTSEGAGYLDGDISVPNTWQTVNIDALLGYLASPAAAAERDSVLGLEPGTTQQELEDSQAFDIIKKPDSTEMEEQVASAYVSVNFEGELANMPWTLNTGLRYAKTETTAFGISRQLLDLVDSGDPTLYIAVLGDPTVVQQTNTYDHLLPNLNYRLNITDDVVGRFALSRTLTRPPFGALSPRTIYGTTRPGNFQASSGNPDLEPFLADNLDVAMEWYYQEGGYVSLGFFRKDVENFLVNTVENRVVPIADSDNLFNGDPTFEVALQDNLESSTVEGFEVGVQHNFESLPGAWSGLGFTANATLVDSNAQLDVDDLSQTFALEGLGDSYNFVGFYDYGKFEARVAWNRRDRFLQVAVGFSGEPVFVTAYDQVDVRFSYAVSDAVSVFIEGVNVTDEKYQKVGRYDNHILLREQTGPRYTLGVRADF